jgi:predicted permease
MSAPRWCLAVLRRLAPAGREEEVAGDLEEVHQARLRRHGRAAATALSIVDTLDMSSALLAARLRARRKRGRGDTGRALTGRRGYAVSILDFKLGARMLLRYPGLTLLGGLAMAFAIFAGAGTYEFLTQVARPRLPLPEGDRIVGVRLWHIASSSVDEQASFDLARWRTALTTVEDLGAFRSRRWNLITENGPPVPEVVAEISASAFRVAAVPPVLGRTLIEADERPGAPRVVVIGYELWQRRLAGNPSVIGMTVRLGDEPHTVVGVMPAGFGFPVAHGLWTATHFGAPGVGPREGPDINVFGRLAPGVSLAEAQEELTLLGAVLSADEPATHEHLRPHVLPWARSMITPPGSISSSLLSILILSTNLPLVLFLILISGNVALLMFARAAGRESELVVRSALGASRARIIAQLVAEALVLAAVACAVGLAAARYGLLGLLNLVRHEIMHGQPLPFWFRAQLSPEAIMYAVTLAILAAAIAGGLPGLKVTRNISTQLRSASAGGGGFRFGGVWTALIVTQIALTVMFPVFAAAMRGEADPALVNDMPIADDDFLVARLAMNTPDPASGAAAPADSAFAHFLETYRTTASRFVDRLSADPRVTGVTFAERAPHMYHYWRQIEVERGGAPARDERGHRMGSSRIAQNYFDVLGVDMLAGRAFHAGDAAAGHVVIVNQSFVNDVLAGGNPIGRRIRVVAMEAYRDPTQEPGPWLEIIGVAPDLGTRSGYGQAGIYHPATVASVNTPHIIVGLGAGAQEFRPELYAAAVAVDPRLRVDDLVTLADVNRGNREIYTFWFRITIGLTAVGLLLSLGGIYAVMAFTVAQRTREIGIRVALGSTRRAILAAVFRRPALQVLAGILMGGALLAVTMQMAGSALSFQLAVQLLVYMAIMACVCMSACVLPTRRALSIEPGRALRSEG